MVFWQGIAHWGKANKENLGQRIVDAAQLVQCMLANMKPQVWSPHPHKQGMMVHASNPNTQEMGVGDFWVVLVWSLLVRITCWLYLFAWNIFFQPCILRWCLGLMAACFLKLAKRWIFLFSSIQSASLCLCIEELRSLIVRITIERVIIVY